jgi:hypothetical protein
MADDMLRKARRSIGEEKARETTSMTSVIAHAQEIEDDRF